MNKAPVTILAHDFLWRYIYIYMPSFPLGICLGMDLMSHRLDTYLPIIDTVEQFPKVVLSIYVPTSYK